MVIVSCDCYTSIPCVGGAPRSQTDLNVCGVFLLTFTLGDVMMLGTLASPESSPPGATHPLSLKTLISGGEKYCSVKSNQVLNSIFPSHKGKAMTSAPERLHKMEARTELTHPWHVNTQQTLVRRAGRSRGTLLAPVSNLAREALSLEARRGVAPPPPMTRHASPPLTVGSARTDVVRHHPLTGSHERAVPARARTNYSMFNIPVSQNPLRHSLIIWRACNPSAWVLRTVTKGYRLQFSLPFPVLEEHSSVRQI